MREVLLVGNPNTGKTTLFNSLTKSNERVGNWHGVTVDSKKKSFFLGEEQALLVDIPGIYSLCPLSFEEGVAVDEILNSKQSTILNICDQNNLQRNLYLTLCLLEMGSHVVLAINETSKKPIFKVDCQKLSAELGIEVVLINAEKKIGIEELKKALAKQNNRSLTQLPYLKKLDARVVNVDFKEEKKDFVLIKLYEKDERFFKKQGVENCASLFSSLPNDCVEQIASSRYEFIDIVMKKCTSKVDKVYGKSKLDKIILNKWLAFPVFLLVMAGVFYLTFFALGAWLSDLLGCFLEVVSKPILLLLKNSFGASWFYDLFSVAIFGGVATVLSFLPQIVLLFFFLSVLEDSGYMSRMAFVFEDVLGKIGLSGKSVYTLLMGFGCSTTAIMTSRNMDDKNAKIKTAILCPYMSCSAKIPIYTVIGGAFFGAKNIFVIMGLYFLGVVVAIAISKILNSTILKSEGQTFILEFPPYRVTNLKRVIKILWSNLKTFVFKVGSIMISMNVIVWLLSSFSFSFSYIPENGGQSILESFGRLLAPFFVPLGFGNWAIVCSLLAGLVAKEVVVSSIAMFNGIDSSATRLLAQSLTLSTSLVFFSSTASVLSFLAFCLLYTPCVASISMLGQEIGKKWTAISILIQFLSAYVISFLIYNIAFAIEVFGFLPIFFVLLGAGVIGLAFYVVHKKLKRKSCAFDCVNCNKKCKNR